MMDVKQNIIDMINSIDNENALNYIRIIVEEVVEDVQFINEHSKEE